MARGMAEEAYEDILSQQQQQQSTHSESPPDSPGAYARSPSVSSCDSKWRSYQPVSNNLEPQQPSADDDPQHEFITTLPDVARSKRPSKRSRVSKPSNRRVVRKGTSQLDASASPSTRTLSPIFSTTVAQGPLASASALPPPRRARSGGGRGDDLLTCMPGDEVVYEDVLY